MSALYVRFSEVTRHEIVHVHLQFFLQSCLAQASLVAVLSVLLMGHSVYHGSGFTKKGTWRSYVGSTSSMDLRKYFHTTSDRPKYMRCWPKQE